MKKIIYLVLFTLISNLCLGQVTVKGVTLGDTLRGESLTSTTLGGIDMAQSILTLNDGRIYLILYTPCKDDCENVSRVYESNVTTIREGLASKFDLKFRKITEEYTDNYQLRATKGDTVFLLTVETNQFMDKPCELLIYIFSDSLYEVNNKEEQEEANTDF